MPFANIRINPTVDTDAYAAGDVAFVNTAFTLPARSCKIISAFAYDKGNQMADGDEFFLYFFRDNVAELGSLNATADITAANFALNKPLIVLNMIMENTVADTELDNVKYMSIGRPHVTAHAANQADDQGILEGDTGVGSGSTCYVAGIVHAGTPDFAAATDLEIVIGVEY